MLYRGVNIGKGMKSRHVENKQNTNFESTQNTLRINEILSEINEIF
jgi:hypothetical protein